MNLSLEILGKCEDLLQFITKKMFDLAGTAVKSSKSSTFWTLLTQLVNESHGSEHLTKHVRLVLKLLKKDPGETSSKEKRVQLHGLLSVIKSAIEEKLLKARNRVIKLVLEDFLFEISSEKNLPKCKNDESRNLAFDILEKSIEIRGKNVRGLIEYLSKFHENTHWRTRNIHDWNYSPASEEKSITGFVGLKNIGNVCYMNSTLQQLYNIPTFCEELLRTNSSDNENSNLRSLQFIFTGLKTSAKQYMSPKRLCLSFKDWEGRPINVAEQMDADEFFNNLMDKLENEMKGMKSEHSIRNHFGGVQITECIGKGACRHKSERAEVFMTLPVQVKNKKSLIESLESFVEGEILENDNAYECDYCESKVTALRRVCIKHLPNILIIVLRRFEFDFDTMNRLKVNDYCEFPMEINMEPYTQEGLERKEMMKEQKEPIAKKFPEDYYKFSLKGITIHAGTAECGHYYSYIKNRRSGNWFEFNDIFVNAFDPDDIPAEAYGGVERWNSFHSSNYSTNTREKYRNAYLLFYERDKHYSYRCKEDEGLEELVIDHSNSQLVSFDEVSEENERYWRCKSIFSPEYLQFVLKLLKNAKGNSQIIQFCCCAFLVIFIRSKDLLRSFDFLIQLEKALVSDDLCKWLSQLICVPAVYKELIVECPIEDKSRLIVQVVTSAFKGLKTVDLRIALNNFLSLFESAAFARNSGNYFKLLSVLVTADPGYAASLGVHVVILNFLANEPVGQTFTADFSIDNYLLGYDPRDQVSFEKVADEKCPCFLPVILNDLAEHFTEDLSKTLFNKSIMKSLANVNHKVGTRNVALLYSSLTGKVKDKKKEYLNFLITLFKENDYDRARIYFRQFKVLVEREENPETVLGLINEAMKETRNYIRVTEVSIDFLFKLCQKYGKVKEWFVRSKEVKWIEQWISNSSYNQRSGFSTFKRTNVMMSNSLPGKSFQERNEIYRKIMKNQLLENDEYDSDDEFPVETLENSSRIDLYDTMAFRWVKANAVLRSKRILAVKLETSNEKGFRWFEIDSEFIAPDGAKVTRNGRI
jgi:ubiquitin C-terminal hydrolase